ncbi:phage terminase large subunit [Spirochaetia bacterium]|nr:phage terminase large subunit [Spirochaetia bacterium]
MTNPVSPQQPILWKPHSKQAQALNSNAFELFYGGAAGGGKSDFLLADYLHGVNEWRKNWKGIIFRHTYDELEELHKRAKELYLPLGAKLIDKGRSYQFSTGATIKFRYLEHDNDVEHYQGHEYTWIGFDELGNYATDFAWRYMISRCRSRVGAPCYIRGTGNPGGPGHAWVKARFIDGFVPGKIFKTTDNGMTITRVFIPSTIEDNPTLMKNDPDYINRLKLLPPHLYRALRFGDWDVFAGQVFEEFRREKHVCKPFPLKPGEWKKFYAFDWGYSKPYALVKLAVNYDGKVIQYGETYGCEEGEFNKGTREPCRDVAAAAWKDAVAEGVTEIIMDPAMWGKQDDVPSPAETFEEVGFITERAHNERVNGWLQIHELLKQTDENQRPMLQFFDTCVHTIRTLPALTPDKNHPEDVDSHLEDHLPDALRYGCMSDYVKNPAPYLRRHRGGSITPKKFDVLKDNGF